MVAALITTYNCVASVLPFFDTRVRLMKNHTGDLLRAELVGLAFIAVAVVAFAMALAALA